MASIRSLTAAVLAALPAFAGASQINTGDPVGAYHADFCPLLSAQLRLAQFDYACAASSGTRESMRRVVAAPQQLGYGHLDVFALESRRMDAGSLTLVRQDDVRVCLYAVTRSKLLSSWKEIGAHAGSLRFVLPPEASDAAATFEFLRGIDPHGLGRAQSVAHALTDREAIREALSADDAVSLLVRLPDPDSAPFELVRRLGGKLIPVMDRAILRQAVDGRKIFFPQEVDIESASWVRSARKLVTACTPLVVFTGPAERIADEPARKDHEDLIRTAGALKADKLLPEASMLGQALKRTKELSASGTERALELTEEARAKAKPYTDKAVEKAREVGDQARQAAEKAGEAAKPYVDKAKKAAQKAYEDAVRLGKELTGQTKPEPAPKQVTGEAKPEASPKQD
jgi:hypothetical protein